MVDRRADSLAKENKRNKVTISKNQTEPGIKRGKKK